MFKIFTKSRHINISLPKKWLFVILPFIAVTFGLLILFLYSSIFNGRIYPGVSVAGIDLGGTTKAQGIEALSSKVNSPDTLSFTYQEDKYDIDLNEVGFAYNYEGSVDSALAQHRTDGLVKNITGSVLSIFTKKNLPLKFELNKEELQKQISVIAEQVSEEPIYPSIRYENSEIIVNSGAPGKDINSEELLGQINFSLENANFKSISVTTKTVDPSLSESEAKELHERANNIKDKSLVLTFERETFTLSGETLFNLLDGKNKYNETKISEYLDSLASQIDRPSQNPVFEFKDGRVQEFLPAKDGVELDKEKMVDQMKISLSDLESSTDNQTISPVAIHSTAPEIETNEVNDLGIKELIGVGTSRFAGSITSRIHNVGLAASKFNGVLVAPGDIVSFNDIVGDISELTGYKQAYIIQDGKTILGDGGGVCQVSTTLFRAVLDAGLPIVERRAHSYRVSYYEQGTPVGIDATVFSPTTDFKFKNDTPGHILIQTYFDAKKTTLKFEIYGTSDGRIAELSTPIITSQTPPPEPLYQDDPTLPAGQVKQIDWAAWGAKVSFDYTVKRYGEVIYEKTFYSNYKPWQAKYLRGTGA